MINFWFSACTGCVQEMPYFAKLSGVLKSKGIKLLGVNPIDPISNAKKTVNLYKLDYPTLTGKEAKAFAESIGVLAYPVTVVLDEKGAVIDAIMGFDQPRLTAALGKLGVVASSAQ